MSYILVLYYSRNGGTEKLARHLARGIEADNHFNARLRTVPALDPPSVDTSPPESAPLCSLEDLRACAGLALGSPTRFGNMAAPLKAFIDTSGGLWAEGALVGRPAMVFTSTASLHGGQETTLLSMALPLLHQGMVLVSLPYAGTDLANARGGGTPYGPSYVSNLADTPSEQELSFAYQAGGHLADIANRLEAS